MTSRSNPLAQQQPISPPDAVLDALKQGLAPVLADCEVTSQDHPELGAKYRSIVIKAHGAEWSLLAEMSSASAYSTGASIARMVVEAGLRAKRAAAG